MYAMLSSLPLLLVLFSLAEVESCSPTDSVISCGCGFPEVVDLPDDFSFDCPSMIDKPNDALDEINRKLDEALAKPQASTSKKILEGAKASATSLSAALRPCLDEKLTGNCNAADVGGGAISLTGDIMSAVEFLEPAGAIVSLVGGIISSLFGGGKIAQQAPALNKIELTDIMKSVLIDHDAEAMAEQLHAQLFQIYDKVTYWASIGANSTKSDEDAFYIDQPIALAQIESGLSTAQELWWSIVGDDLTGKKGTAQQTLSDNPHVLAPDETCQKTCGPFSDWPDDCMNEFNDVSEKYTSMSSQLGVLYRYWSMVQAAYATWVPIYQRYFLEGKDRERWDLNNYEAQDFEHDITLYQVRASQQLIKEKLDYGQEYCDHWLRAPYTECNSHTAGYGNRSSECYHKTLMSPKMTVIPLAEPPEVCTTDCNPKQLPKGGTWTFLWGSDGPNCKEEVDDFMSYTNVYIPHFKDDSYHCGTDNRRRGACSGSQRRRVLKTALCARQSVCQTKCTSFFAEGWGLNVSSHVSGFSGFNDTTPDLATSSGNGRRLRGA